jgi:hypothetical protein
MSIKRFKLEDDVTYVGKLKATWMGKVVGIKDGKIKVAWYLRPPDIGWEFEPHELEKVSKQR